MAGKQYEPQRLEAAAEQALKYNTYSFKSVRAILAAGLDRQQDIDDPPRQANLPIHTNIWGR